MEKNDRSATELQTYCAQQREARSMGATRKPAGFWTRGVGKNVTELYVKGELTLEEAVAAIREACEPIVDAAYLTDAILEEDVKWYARDARKRPQAGVSTGAKVGEPPIEHVAMGEGGRLVIPARYRQALGLRDGDEVIVWLDGEELRILTPGQALRRAQVLLRRYVPAERSLADEIIDERRREARRE